MIAEQTEVRDRVHDLRDQVEQVDPLRHFARSNRLHCIADQGHQILVALSETPRCRDWQMEGLVTIVHGSAVEAISLQPRFAVLRTEEIVLPFGISILRHEEPFYHRPKDGRKYEPWSNNVESIWGFNALIKTKIRIAYALNDPRFLHQARTLIEKHTPHTGSEGPGKNYTFLDEIMKAEEYLKQVEGQVWIDRQKGKSLTPTKLDIPSALSLLDDLYWSV